MLRRLQGAGAALVSPARAAAVRAAGDARTGWSETTWRRFVALVAVGAALVRVAIILANPHGGFDLHLYTYFGRLINQGLNPYHGPAAGAVDPIYGDNPVGELGFFAGILRLHDAPTTIRIVFLLADLASIAIVAFCFRRSYWWRGNLIVFIAFNPFLLVRESVYAEDKTVLGLVIIVILLAVERGADALTWGGSAVLGALKWISAYFLIPLAAFTVSRRGARTGLVFVAAGVGLFALSCIPYFPDSVLDPFNRRQARTKLAPDHASLLKFLDSAGIYSKALPSVFIIVSLLAIYALFFRSRIDVREAIVLSFAASLLFLPDDTRSEFILVPFLFIMRLSTWRWVAIWVTSVIAIVPTGIASGRFYEKAQSGFPLARPLYDFVGGNASLQYTALTSLLLALILGLYAWDRLHGLVDIEQSRDLRLRPRAAASSPGG